MPCTWEVPGEFLDNKTDINEYIMSLSARLPACLRPQHSSLRVGRVPELGLPEKGPAPGAKAGGGAWVAGGVNSLRLCVGEEEVLSMTRTGPAVPLPQWVCAPWTFVFRNHGTVP